MGLAGARAKGPERARKWRLVFEPPGPQQTIAVAKGDPDSIDDAVRAIRSRLRAAMEAGGCRSVVIGVHVEGPACDHEV